MPVILRQHCHLTMDSLILSICNRLGGGTDKDGSSVDRRQAFSHQVDGGIVSRGSSLLRFYPVYFHECFWRHRVPGFPAFPPETLAVNP